VRRAGGHGGIDEFGPIHHDHRLDRNSFDGGDGLDNVNDHSGTSVT
jgi:hypothetical protein